MIFCFVLFVEAVYCCFKKRSVNLSERYGEALVYSSQTFSEEILLLLDACVWLIGHARYNSETKAWPSHSPPPCAAPSLISLCHRGPPATLGHRAPGGRGQTPDQHQRTEAFLPGDGGHFHGPLRVGEETVFVARPLPQNGWRTYDRAPGSAGCKLLLLSVKHDLTQETCVDPGDRCVQ